MILQDKFNQTTTISCESCDSEFTTNTPMGTSMMVGVTWMKAINELKKKEWSIELSKKGDKWLTYCDNCK